MVQLAWSDHNQWIQYLAQQSGLKVTTDGSGATAAFNTVTGGLCIIWVARYRRWWRANFYNECVMSHQVPEVQWRLIQSRHRGL